MPTTPSERRPVPGLDGVLEVDRRCHLYHPDSDEPLVFAWPEARISVRGHTVGVHAGEAAALAFLSPEERRALQMDEALLGVSGAKDRRVLARARALQLSEWAIWEVIRLDTHGMTLPKRLQSLAEAGPLPAGAEVSALPDGTPSPAADAVPLATWVDEGDVVDAAFEAYPTPVLLEPSRSPSRGGNTKAEHRHRLLIDSIWYAFRAPGAKKWAYVGDRVSFHYVVTRDGYRNIVRDTFRAADARGQPVVRGEREGKPARRTATQAVGSRKMRRE